jgi:hypothetical protein
VFFRVTKDRLDLLFSYLTKIILIICLFFPLMHAMTIIYCNNCRCRQRLWVAEDRRRYQSWRLLRRWHPVGVPYSLRLARRWNGTCASLYISRSAYLDRGQVSIGRFWLITPSIAAHRRTGPLVRYHLRAYCTTPVAHDHHHVYQLG